MNQRVLGISKENRDFIDNLVNYYISEAHAYIQFAEKTTSEVSSTKDTALGIIIGCIYSGFLNAYQNQQKNPDLEDLKEFNEIIRERAPLIKKAIIDIENKT